MGDFGRIRCGRPIRDDAKTGVIDTFPVMGPRGDAMHGEYRTKRVILDIYDEMAEAMRTGASYRTRLDPPLGDPRYCHPPRETRSA